MEHVEQATAAPGEKRDIPQRDAIDVLLQRVDAAMSALRAWHYSCHQGMFDDCTHPRCNP